MFIILFFLFPIILSAESYCDSGEEVSLFNCSETNRALSDERVLYTRPIFAGRCCYKDKKCFYMDESDPFKWISNNYNCFSGVEKCYYKGEVGYKDYISCYSIPTEQPYSCCYIGNRKKSQCFPINVLKKSIFRETINHLRTYYGDFDGNYEVICQGNFIKTIFWILVFLIF